MKRNAEITELANSIMLDITENRSSLHLIMLKSSRLSKLLDEADWTKWFIENAKIAENADFAVGSFAASIDAARDHSVAVSSSNPSQYVYTPIGNFAERNNIKAAAALSVNKLSELRSATYTYASNIYAKWQFGNIAESIFERKRASAEQVLKSVFKDANERLNSIEQNLRSINPEDWKNAINSCRTLLMDLADVLNPAKTAADKQRFINRLKDFISPKIDSDSHKDLQITYLEELKNVLEYVTKTTQGGAHQDRPSKEIAETIVLHVYLIIANIMEVYSKSTKTTPAAKIRPPAVSVEN
ncbi:MAG: hypothetical protein V1926_05350 [Candidatus Peregrinibacteria bacterium]